MSFDTEGLIFLNSTISLSDKCIPRELKLNLKGLSEENKLEDIFILVEKDYKKNIILLYKKKFLKDTSIIVVYLSVVMVKKYGNSTLLIFEPYF